MMREDQLAQLQQAGKGRVEAPNAKYLLTI